MDVSPSLKVARTQQNLKQIELSCIAGVSQITISDIENGKVRPYKSTRKKLEAVLGTIDWSTTFDEGIIHRKRRQRRFE